MAIWVLTRNRPTGPRRGTTVLIMGAAALPFGGGALAAHFWIGGLDAAAWVVLLVRLVLAAGALAWAGLTVAAYREERRAGVRAYGARAGLAILGLVTAGVLAGMVPGVIDAIRATAA